MNIVDHPRNFARVAAAHADRVELTFIPDGAPWFSLLPQHLVLLEKYQFFGSLTALDAMKLVDPTRSTALTHFRWTTPVVPPETGFGTRGTCTRVDRADGAAFTLDVFAADGTCLMTCLGEGVIFANRDFAGWRAQTKENARAAWAALDAPIAVEPAPPSAVGLGAGGVSFVARPRQVDGTLVVDALVTQAGGFHPAHPFHGGSGDHVNAAQMFDCVMQASHLVLDADRPLHCLAGDARFARYIELDIPFRLTLVERGLADGNPTLTWRLSQLGRENATIGFTLC